MHLRCRCGAVQRGAGVLAVRAPSLEDFGQTGSGVGADCLPLLKGDSGIYIYVHLQIQTSIHVYNKRTLEHDIGEVYINIYTDVGM